VPIAVGESLYSTGQFAAYVQQGAASILQVDVARIGGITPWLKVAHLAEACNLAVCPHFLMELHVSLCAAVPSAAWLEYIPQLDAIADSRLVIEDGHASAPDVPGLGIAWRWDEIKARSRATHRLE
jgi:L-alanine-DL-glutamate epimerase-like enolase superfamily enzyme